MNLRLIEDNRYREKNIIFKINNIESRTLMGAWIETYD